jgi:putative transposase
LAGIRTPARVLWILSRLGPREWEGKSAASTLPRRWKAESAICSLTPKVWCSKPKIHSAKVADEDGIRLLLESARERFGRLSHLWVDAGYRGRGRRWAEEVLGVSVEVVRKPQKPLPEKVAKVWAAEWAKEGKEVDWQRLMLPRGFRVLPRRWVVERTFAWISHNRRMAKDYEGLCATGEAFVYAAMSRLMVRRLARA